jgi:hypothetical protein
MSLDLNKNNGMYHSYTPYLAELKTIYAGMDKQYREAASYYDFNCAGCKDNCCFTHFYHHTLLEYLYVLEGFNGLDREKKIEIKSRASTVCRKNIEACKKGITVRLMCPLNADGLCALYSFRPMICRLHGIPHEFEMPDGSRICRPGCEAFSRQCAGKNYFKFDRTPFYKDVAGLEKELRRTAGMTQKIKMTIAQMITGFEI